MVGRTRTNEGMNERSSGRMDRTDRQKGKQPSRHRGEQADERTESAGRAAGRLNSNDLATSHRTPEDLYPELAQSGVARHGMAWHGSARLGSTRLASRLRSESTT